MHIDLSAVILGGLVVFLGAVALIVIVPCVLVGSFLIVGVERGRGRWQARHRPQHRRTR